MLAESALRQGLQPVVLAESEAPPAGVPGVQLVHGALDDAKALREVFAQSRWVTVENEFLNLDRIREAMEAFPSVRFHPGIAGIAVAQDKLKQKELFARLAVPSPEYDVIAADSLDRDLERVGSRFTEGFVLKWSRFGYDGRGNFEVRPDRPGARDEIEAFARAAEDAGGGVYAEGWVDFECELAMVSARSEGGQQAFFPLVVSRQERGVCREVVAPAVDVGVARELEARVRDILRAVGDYLDMCGAFAMEFFLTPDGRVLVNEMAPRVHNTGHYTLFGDEPSQFDLHVQAVTGAELALPAVRSLSAMRNLLGPREPSHRRPCPAPTATPPSGTMLYWYGKHTVAPGRKMGHLTGRARSREELTHMLTAMEAYEAEFWATIPTEEREER
jgi:5-(carboxyamino)imidazole ribonucleotide synthase